MSLNQQKSSWVVGLLAICMGLAFIVSGAWMTSRYFTYPQIEASEFNASQHDGSYIQLNSTEALEVGSQFEYDPDDPKGMEDPTNQVARLLGIPVGNRLLIVRVPVEHQGQSFTGVVKGLTYDIEIGLAKNRISNVFQDIQQYADSAALSLDSASPWATQKIRRTPSLDDIVLPVYLDAKEDERWAIGLAVFVGILSLFGGFKVIHESRSTAHPRDSSHSMLD